MGLSTNIGLRALLTSQSALDTIGHNVANATTEGYSRQRVLTSSSRPLNLRGLQLGNGVDANVVTRSVDELLTLSLVEREPLSDPIASALAPAPLAPSVLCPLRPPRSHPRSLAPPPPCRPAARCIR